MMIRYDRPVSRSAFLARRLGLLSLGMLVVALLLHRFGPLKTPEFVLLVCICAVPALMAVPLAAVALLRLWTIGALGGVAAVWALIYATVPLALPGYAIYLYQKMPQLTEVSTDLADPPKWVSDPTSDQRFLPRLTPSASSAELQLKAYPGLNGRRYEGAIDRVYEAVQKVADENRLTVTATRGEAYVLPDLTLRPAEEPAAGQGPGGTEDALPETGPLPSARPLPGELAAERGRAMADGEPEGTARLQMTTRTLVLGLPFDAVVRLREEAEMTLVDIRVAARYGSHDLGFSDEIAEGFLHALDAALLGIAGN
ncbi:DUF1499 domain-containing protein [Peteryoungia ipomoeae]|uniref:DUF1499 domain-containing protein n=1 Tax=Peteryoungia ipomoeae TaxID=1210932 RepID=A0A4S8P5R0_9HYPH|nr:DUF1499 domain-containing protein [Peteryoungia ipomoeae]THV23079.1 DUF1499 domain-containing protein [Peteryoungia ipomoeae]